MTEDPVERWLVCSNVSCQQPAVHIQRIQPYENGEAVGRCYICNMMFNTEMAVLGSTYQQIEFGKKIKITRENQTQQL